MVLALRTAAGAGEEAPALRPFRRSAAGEVPLGTLSPCTRRRASAGAGRSGQLVRGRGGEPGAEGVELVGVDRVAVLGRRVGARAHVGGERGDAGGHLVEQARRSA